MKGLYSISGYFADDKTDFENYLVYEYDNHPEELPDEDIFYYGISEAEIREAIKTGEPVQNEFVITSYQREWQEEPEQPNTWEFVEKYYPEYYTSDKIALATDLHKIIEGEYEEGDDAHQLLQREYDGDTESFQLSVDYFETKSEIYETAIANFQLKLQEQDKLSTFIVKHDHRFGSDVYLVKSNKELTTFINEDNPPNKSEKLLIDKLEIDFENKREESIEISKIHPEEAITF